MSHPAAALRAIIAEDEPLLATALQQQLGKLWPALETQIVGDGESAVAEAIRLRPTLLFLDIHMPCMDGLEAAAALAEAWDDAAAPFPLIAFVTAYDQYAIQAFERGAVDYVLKPVQPERLATTLQRMQTRLAESAQQGTAPPIEATLAQLRTLLTPALTQAPLRVIQASVGAAIAMVQVEDVVYFEAADKYVRVMTASTEYLVRTPVRELIAQLDPTVFWQIHRGTVVRSTAIAKVTRDAAGKLTAHLRDRPEKLAVSRIWAHRFKAM
jgi:DNA-binding LytR/AlgR family response regulator